MNRFDATRITFPISSFIIIGSDNNASTPSDAIGEAGKNQSKIFNGISPDTTLTAHIA
jgi:hypothetical protein